MRGKRNLNILWGAVIGCFLGLIIYLLLPILIFWSPTLYFLADMMGRIVEPLTEVGGQLICGSSPDIGCISGIGIAIFFLAFPLVFCLFWALTGAVIVAVFTKIESP